MAATDETELDLENEYLTVSEIWEAYEAACDEAKIWREDYPEFERLMNNGLLDDLDESLPEVNDGSLAAALFKLPKRIFNSDISGRAKALDVDDSWITELANIELEDNIIPNANSQAPFHRKWKDCIRKAAGLGGQPIVTLFVHRGDYEGADFICPQAQDVKLQAGRSSDYDSDIIFWDVYYDKFGLKRIIAQAKEDNEDAKEEKAQWEARKAEHDAMRAVDPEMPEFEEEFPEPYNIWDVDFLTNIYKNHQEEDRDPDEDAKEKEDKGVKKGGYHFVIAFQRGVGSPFKMLHSSDKDKEARCWSNPDPSGDTPVHYLYCYQDFVNPYGIGIVKLAGGTQNVLDFMRQSDVKATQLGIDPPKKFSGDLGKTDIDSIVTEQGADWFTGDADVAFVEISNGVYQAIPNRMAMYKSALNQMIPMGDTSIPASAGDPNQSKTPAGVKAAVASLSIDDEDFKDNLYMTYGAVMCSLINTDFANMQGSDFRDLSDEQRDILVKSGLDFPIDPLTNIPGNRLEVLWDEARARFKYEVLPEDDKAKDDEQKLTGLLSVAKFAASDPNFDAYMMEDGKKLNRGELYSDIISLTSDNKKIIEDVSPEDQAQMQDEAAVAEQQAMAGEQGGQPGQPAQPGAEGQPTGAQELVTGNDTELLQQIMERYNVDQGTASAMLAAERSGFEPQEILEALQRRQQPAQPQPVPEVING